MKGLLIVAMLLMTVMPAMAQQAQTVQAEDEMQNLMEEIDGFIKTFEYQLYADSVWSSRFTVLAMYQPLVDSLKMRGEYFLELEADSWIFSYSDSTVSLECFYIEGLTGFRALRVELFTPTMAVAFDDVGLNGIDFDADYVYANGLFMISEKSLLAGRPNKARRPTGEAELRQQLQVAVSTVLASMCQAH